MLVYRYQISLSSLFSFPIIMPRFLVSYYSSTFTISTWRVHTNSVPAYRSAKSLQAASYFCVASAKSHPLPAQTLVLSSSLGKLKFIARSLCQFRLLGPLHYPHYHAAATNSITKTRSSAHTCNQGLPRDCLQTNLASLITLLPMINIGTDMSMVEATTSPIHPICLLTVSSHH